MIETVPRPAWRALNRPMVLISADVVTAVVFALLEFRALNVGRSFWLPRAPDGLAPALVGVACAGIAARRLAPVPALAATAAASAAGAYLGFGQDPMVALGLVLYLVATRESWLVSAGALVTAQATVLVAALSPAQDLMPAGRVISSAFVQAAAWTMGTAVRAQRVYAAGLREQADRRVQAEIDRSRRTLAEERLRIARELHDIVAHTMSVIAVQAGVGAHIMARRPDAGRDALRAIEGTSREALRDLRDMLGVLRDGGAQDGTSTTADAELRPAPGLDSVAELVARTRETGLSIDLAVVGTPTDPPHGVALAAYRIVQESLTNVVRHAEAGRARVELVYSPREIGVTVTDDGSGCAAPEQSGSGHGLVGMRERVALYGGRFQAGPLPAGGYRVHAVFPLSDGDRSVATAGTGSVATTDSWPATGPTDSSSATGPTGTRAPG